MGEKILYKKFVQGTILILLTASLAISVAVLNQYSETNILLDTFTRLTRELQISVDQLNETLMRTINSTFYSLQKQASYIISTIQSGATTYYTMQNGTTGALADYSINASRIINYAGGNLTSGRNWYETVLLKGNFTIDSPIQIGNWTELCGPATIWMKAGMRTNMIQNLDRISVGNAHIYVHDLTFHGRYSEHSGQGNAIDLYNPTYLGADGEPCVWIERLNFYEVSNNSISFYNINAADVTDILVKTCERGVLLRKVLDSFFARFDLYAADDGYLFAERESSGNHFSDIYLGGADALEGQLLLENVGYDLWENLRIDYSGFVSMKMNGTCRGNQLNNFQISQPSLNANATYDAIIISDASLYNQFSNGQIMRKESATYANATIREIGSSDHNTFTDVNCYDSGKYGILTGGANTKVTDSWNGTVYVGSGEPSDYSYLVYTDGTNYYMQNGKNSQIDYQSTNATKVLSNTFGNASLVQGSVHIKPGTYLINQASIGSNTKVYGEPGTIIKLAAGQANGSEEALQVANAENVTISDLTIDCNLPAYLSLSDKIAIAIVNSRHVTIQDSYIQNSRIYGVLVSSSRSDVYDINILHNKFYNIGYNAITFSTYGPGAFIHDCLVDGNYIEGTGDIGLDTQTAGENFGLAPYRICFTNNHVNGTILPVYRGFGSSATNSTSYGLRLENGNDCLVSNNYFYGVNIGMADGGDITTGGNNTFISNSVTNDGLETYAGIGIGGANEKVQFNTFYVGWAEWNIGIDIDADNCTIIGNTIINQGGSAHVSGIGSDVNPNSEIVLDNVIIGCEYPWNIRNGNFSIVKNNIGYNPVGIISTPAYGSYLVDNIQGTRAIANNTLYTCWQSPKDIYISGGIVSSVQVEGTTVFTATDCMVHVEPDDTFKIVWSSAPIIVVIGE